MNSAIMESRNCLKETESIGKDRIVDRYLTEIVCSGGNIPESLMPDALDVLCPRPLPLLQRNANFPKQTEIWITIIFTQKYRGGHFLIDF